MAGCGAVKIAHVGDVEVFESGVLVCGDDAGVGGWWGGEAGGGLWERAFDDGAEGGEG